jgi:hypothetical protein
MDSILAAEELRENGYAAYEPDALERVVFRATGSKREAEKARIERIRQIQEAKIAAEIDNR